MTTPDIERAARAVLADLGIVVDLSDPHRHIQLSTTDLLGVVEAVLEALAEPSDAAVEAAFQAIMFENTFRDNPRRAIRAALRAANLAVLGRKE